MRITSILDEFQIEEKRMDIICIVIADLMEVDIEFAISKGKGTKKKEYVLFRSMCYFILRHRYGYSYSGIGRYFNRNHASVIHSAKRIRYDLAENYNGVKPQYKEILSVLKSTSNL